MASGKKPLVVVTRRLPDSVEMRMRELFDARLNADDKPMSHAELVAAAKTADVIVPTVDRKSTRLNSSHQIISYAVFCLKKKKTNAIEWRHMDSLGTVGRKKTASNFLDTVCVSVV